MEVVDDVVIVRLRDGPANEGAIRAHEPNLCFGMLCGRKIVLDEGVVMVLRVVVVTVLLNAIGCKLLDALVQEPFIIVRPLSDWMIPLDRLPLLFNVFE